MQYRYIIVGNGRHNSVLNELFRDVIDEKVSSVKYVEPYIFPNKFVEFLYRLYYSKIIRNIIPFLPNGIWRRFSVANSIEIVEPEKTFILYVIGRDVNRLVDKKILRNIKNKYGENVSNVLILMDSIDVTTNVNGWGKVTSIFYLYDKVATFDLNDAEKYKLLHIKDPYSKRKVEVQESKKANLFFIGDDKKRSKTLCDIAKRAQNYDLLCNFLIWELRKERCEIGVKKLKEFIKYEEMLAYVVSSDCLVEVLAEGQSSSSLRYYEAVVYNKKLLTNNKNIFKESFYHEEYIQYFEKVEDIDYEWIKKDVKVDYGYCNEFSIERFLNKITVES